MPDTTPTLCPRCGRNDGHHGLVHVNDSSGGRANLPCPNTPAPQPPAQPPAQPPPVGLPTVDEAVEAVIQSMRDGGWTYHTAARAVLDLIAARVPVWQPVEPGTVIKAGTRRTGRDARSGGITPETIAELWRRHAALTPFALRFLSGGPGGEPFIALACEDGTPLPEPAFDAVLLFAELAAAELPALLDAAAERDALAESVRAYGRTIDRWGLLIIAATHSEDITTPDGDCDWEVIESRLAEVPALLAERDALAAKVERVRALHASSGTAESQGYDAEGEYGLIAPYCTGCEASDEYATAWPCPTIRALDTTPDTGGES